MKVASAATNIADAVNVPTFCSGRASPRVKMKNPEATISALVQMAGPVLRAASVAAAMASPEVGVRQAETMCTA